MNKIPNVIEAVGAFQPNYAGKDFSDAEIKSGKHRQWIGSHWEDHGDRQLEFLKSRGLKRSHKFVDIGCGCFRAGRPLIDYLDAGNYFGIDTNESLLQVGYDIELSDAQRGKLPIGNVRVTDRFNVDFGVKFDFAIAQSVFSHVDLNLMRLCLYRTGLAMKQEGKFFATFYEAPANRPLDEIIKKPNRRPMFHERNTYWYYKSDLEWIASGGSWKTNYIGGWGHPAGQKMMEYIRRAE